MFEQSADIVIRERICNGQYITFYSLEMCNTVRKYNGPDNEFHRQCSDFHTGEKFLDRSYQEPDYMNLVDLAEQLMNVNGVEHIAFMPYSIRVFIPKHFEASVVINKCAPIIETWIFTRGICKEATANEQL